MSQSHIILVRHGEASAGWSVHPDPGLSAQGREQAENSGKSLINELSYYQLLSSPKKRAIETCLLYTSPSPRDRQKSRMPSSA